MNQIHIISATQTALKEVLINSEKKGRFLLDCQFVIKTIIIVNLIEKIPPKYNLVKLASCLVLKHIVENHETSANRSKKFLSKIADNAKFQFNEMQKVVCGKHFDEFIKLYHLNDRLDVFLGKYFP